MQQTEWITTKQALQLLQISSRTTLDRYAKTFNIKVSKPLGRKYFSRMDILAAIESKAVISGV